MEPHQISIPHLDVNIAFVTILVRLDDPPPGILHLAE
jgi:hypothetical protein